MPPVIFVISVLLIFIIYKYLNYILIPKNLLVYILAILLIIIGIVFIISTFYSFHKHRINRIYMKFNTKQIVMNGKNKLIFQKKNSNKKIQKKKKRR